VPPYFAGPSAPSTGTPPASGGPSVTAPPASGDPGPAPGASNETPVTNGETPLAGGENGSGEGGGPGDGDPATQPPQDPGSPQDPGQPPQNPEGPPPQNPPARPPGGTANLFSQILGRSQGEVDAKVQTAVDRFFGIGTNDPATPTLNGGARSFYTLPQDPGMGFIWAADSNDIRSEGMSYGM
jgi:hypothetical protein